MRREPLMFVLLMFCSMLSFSPLFGSISSSVFNRPGMMRLTTDPWSQIVDGLSIFNVDCSGDTYSVSADEVEITIKYFPETGNYGIALNPLIALGKSLITLFLALDGSEDWNEYLEHFHSKWQTLELPFVPDKPVVSLKLFGDALCFHLNADCELYYLVDHTYRYEQKMDAGLSVRFNDRVSLHMNARAFLFSCGSGIDSDDFTFGSRFNVKL